MKRHYSHLRISLFILIISLLFLWGNAHASDILTQIGKGYQTESAKWFPKLLEIAKGLFWKLAAIEFAWASILWVLKNNDMQSFTSAVVQKIIGIGFFFMLLQNADYWIPAIVQGLTKSGQYATNMPGLTPSEIFDVGIDTAVALLNGIKKLSLWDDFGTVIVGGWSALFIVVAFLIIAGQMLVALIESYIAISGGVLFLGFGGSRWTTDFTQKYISYAVSTGVKIFVLYLIIGVGTSQAKTWAAMLATTDFNNIFSVLGGSVLLAFLGFQIPNMAASMLSGSPSLTAGSAVGTAGAVAAGTVAAGAGALAAGSGALQSARGGMQALKASYDHHRASGSNPLSSALKAPLTSTLDMGRASLGMTGSLQTNTAGGAAAEYRQGQTAAMKEKHAAGSAGTSTNDSSSTGGGNSTPPPNNGSTPTGGGNNPSPPPDSGSTPVSGGSPTSPPSSGGSGAFPDSTVGVANIAGGNPSSSTKTEQQSNAEKSKGGSGTKTSAVLPQGTATGKKLFENLKRVRPPQIPHDGAPSASVHIKLSHSED